MLDERKIARRAGLPGRADRRRPQDAGLLRRARGAVRPAGHGPAEHGRRLRRPLRARRRAQLRPGRQAHLAVAGARQHLRDRRRRRHPGLQGRLGGALLGRDLRRELPRARRRPADDRRPSTGTPTASSSPATARRCSSTSTTTPSRCPASTRCPASARSPAGGDPGQPPRASSRSGWMYWHLLLPGRPMPLPAHMSMAGKHADTDQPHREAGG